MAAGARVHHGERRRERKTERESQRCDWVLCVFWLTLSANDCCYRPSWGRSSLPIFALTSQDCIYFSEVNVFSIHTTYCRPRDAHRKCYSLLTLFFSVPCFFSVNWDDKISANYSPLGLQGHHAASSNPDRISTSQPLKQEQRRSSRQHGLFEELYFFPFNFLKPKVKRFHAFCALSLTLLPSPSLYAHARSHQLSTDPT